MSSFYQEISTYYDYIFPTNKGQVKFLEELFKKHKVNKLLDIACGSGNYTIEFAKLGVDTVGVDLELEMVEKAKKKGEGLNNIQFQKEDMRKLSFNDQTFNGVLCIGNSLPHVLEDGDLKQSASEMYRVLETAGVAVIQTVNYDRILNNKIDELPFIKNEEVGLEFIRKYHFREDGLIDFNTTLVLEKKGERYENTVILRPLRTKELEDLFKGVGFSEVSFLGAFDGREFSDESPATILIVKK